MATDSVEHRLHRILNRLDIEDDDAIRAALIDDVLALCDRYPNLAPQARAYGIPA
jgi:hypothetical protein